MKGQGRAQRTKLAPLSKTCKVTPAKQCLRSFYLIMWPPQSWTELIRTENNLRLKGVISIEYLREKGKSKKKKERERKVNPSLKPFSVAITASPSSQMILN